MVHKMNYDTLHERYINLCNEAIETHTQPLWQPNSVVSKAAWYSLMNGGKRVRGVLVFAVSDMLHGDTAVAAAFACALEMEHAFSLIHDDLPCMDDDEVRRGKPACHIAYGEPNALLAGDLLALGAFEVLAGAEAKPSVCLDAVRVLAAAAGARGMIYGQELDMKYEQQQADASALLATQKHKTGALFGAAVELGALAAGQQISSGHALGIYAQNVGLVFQIVDDILDTTADEKLLGKPVGSDIAQGKATYVTLFGEENARKKARQLTDDAVALLRAQYGTQADFLSEFALRLAGRVF